MDHASTISYILPEVEKPIGARRKGYDSATINVVGGTAVSEGPLVGFNLKTTDGEEIPITAKVIPQIVPNIKTKKYKEAIDTCHSQHPDLDLPTFAGEEIRIHMLLAGGAANALTG